MNTAIDTRHIATDRLMITLHEARIALSIRDEEEREEQFRMCLARLCSQISSHLPSYEPEPSDWYPYEAISTVDPWSAVYGVLTLALDNSFREEALSIAMSSDHATWHHITDTCLEILKGYRAAPDEWLSGEAFTAQLEEYKQLLREELEVELMEAGQ